MKNFIKKIIIIVLFSIYALPVVSFAAEVFVSTPQNITIHETFEVLINANTDGELINSANIVLHYDNSLLSFSGYKNEGAMINLWIHSPYEKNSSIYMDGIIPGGVSGLYDPKKENPAPIPLARLLFNAKKAGNAEFSFTKTEILKHDGKGTQLVHRQIGGNIEVIKKENELVKIENVLDKEKPEPFNVTFLESSVSSQTPSLIIFKANDLGSGIKEYQMSINGSEWVLIKSPQPVTKGLLPYTITVRAFDFDANFQDSSIRIPGAIPTWVLWSIAILVGVLFCIIAYRMIKYRR